MLIFEFIQRAWPHQRLFVPVVGTVTVQEFAEKLLCPGEGSCKERLHRQELNALNPQHVIFDLSCFSLPKISLGASAEQFRAIMWEVCGVTCCRHRTGLGLGSAGSCLSNSCALQKPHFWLAFPGPRQEIGQEAPKIMRILGVLNSFNHYLALTLFLVVPDPCRANAASHFCKELQNSKRNWNVGLSRTDQKWNFHFHGIWGRKQGRDFPTDTYCIREGFWYKKYNFLQLYHLLCG